MSFGKLDGSSASRMPSISIPVSAHDPQSSTSAMASPYDRPEASYSGQRSSSPASGRGDVPYSYLTPHPDFDSRGRVRMSDMSDTYRHRRMPEPLPYHRTASEDYYYRSRDIDPWTREDEWRPNSRIQIPIHVEDLERLPPPPPLPRWEYRSPINRIPLVDDGYEPHRRWNSSPDRQFEPSAAWKQTHGEEVEQNEAPLSAPPSVRQRSRTADDRPAFRDPRDDHYPPPFRESVGRVDYRAIDPDYVSPEYVSLSSRSPGSRRCDSSIPRSYPYDDQPPWSHRDYPIPREDRIYEVEARRMSYNRDDDYPPPHFGRRYPPPPRPRYDPPINFRGLYPASEAAHSRIGSRRVSVSSQRSAQMQGTGSSPTTSVHNRSGPGSRSWNRDTSASATSARGDITPASSIHVERFIPKREPEDLILPASRQSPRSPPQTHPKAPVTATVSSVIRVSQRSEPKKTSGTSLTAASDEGSDTFSVASSRSILSPSPNVGSNGASQLRTEVSYRERDADQSDPRHGLQKPPLEADNEHSDSRSGQPLSGDRSITSSSVACRSNNPKSVDKTASEAMDIDSAVPAAPGPQAVATSSHTSFFERTSSEQSTTAMHQQPSPLVRSRLIDEGTHTMVSPRLRVTQAMEIDEPSTNSSHRNSTTGGYADSNNIADIPSDMEEDFARTSLNMKDMHRRTGQNGTIETVVNGRTISSPSLIANERFSEAHLAEVTSNGTYGRPAPDDDGLLKAIARRRIYDSETREQRVNRILIANLSLNENAPVWPRPPTAPDVFVKEIFTKTKKEAEETDMHSILLHHFDHKASVVADKQERLKKEYMELQEKWSENCARLDSILKAGVSEELVIVTGRTTRRTVVTSDAVRSDLEMERIIASLGNEDLTDPNQLAVRNTATIPDMISVMNGEVEFKFDDTNGQVRDPEVFYDACSGFLDWIDEEKQIFYEKYSEYPKQFATIASFLPHKTTAQCVLYYYIHKKRLVDFRKAANMGTNKKRKAGRPGKQKSNALLADIQLRDEEKPKRGRRKSTQTISTSGPESSKGPGKRTAAVASGVVADESADATPEAEAETKPKRRKGIHWAKLLASEQEVDSNMSADTDSALEPPRKLIRRTRKPKGIDSPGDSPTPDAKFVDGNDSVGRRRGPSTTAFWSDRDKADFMKLLARHGKNFKRISASMPNKTTVQVQNYFKNHSAELELEKVAASAQSRSPSVEAPPPPRDPWLNATHLTGPSASSSSLDSQPAVGDSSIVQQTVEAQGSGVQSSTTPETTKQPEHGQQMWYREDYPGPSPFLRPHHPYQPHNGMAQPQHRYMAVLHPPPVPMSSRSMGTPPMGMMHSGAGVFQIHPGAAGYGSHMPSGSGFASMPASASNAFQFSAYKPPTFQPFSTRALRGYGMMQGQMTHMQMQGGEGMPQQGVFMERRIMPHYAMPVPPSQEAGPKPEASPVAEAAPSA